MGHRKTFHAAIDEACFIEMVGADLKNTAEGHASPVHVVPWQPVPGDLHKDGSGPFREAMARAVKRFGGQSMSVAGTYFLSMSEASAQRDLRKYAILVLDWKRSSMSDYGLSSLKAFLDTRQSWGSHWVVVEHDQAPALMQALEGRAALAPDGFYTVVDLQADAADPAAALGLRAGRTPGGFLRRLFGSRSA